VMAMTKNSYFNENTLDELIEEIKFVYQSDDRPWVIGYSGGKDSTAVVELVYKMLLSLPDWQRNKNVYIVSSDTLIENPLIKIYLNKMNYMLGQAALRDGLPIRSTMVTPLADNSSRIASALAKSLSFFAALRSSIFSMMYVSS